MQPFYLSDGDRLIATESTRGPWSNVHQHAGPPSALLVRAAEAAAPDMALARITVEMQRPVPIGEMTVRVDVEKPGRKALVLRAALEADGAVCLVARVVMMRVADVGAPVVSHGAVPRPVDVSPPFEFNFFRHPVGYHTAMEARLARGAWGQGDMALWMRQRVPLVAGEAPSPAQRVLVIADAGSGVSAALDPRRFGFLNADLTVHLLRPPAGEWVLMDSQTFVVPDGRALADTALFDAAGRIGRSAQSLVVDPMPPAAR
jgi:hypothetical protein